MEVFLNVLLPNHLPKVCTYQIHSHKGRKALMKRLAGRLRGYGKNLPREYRIIVVMDQDATDCLKLKEELESICASAGLRSRRSAGSHSWQVVTRIVIEELEAWYFGDWSAVRAAYPKVSPNIPQQAPYRRPDAIKGGTWEAFERVMQDSGYYQNGLSKLEVAAQIASHITPTNNKSHSFRMFWSVLLEALSPS